MIHTCKKCGQKVRFRIREGKWSKCRCDRKKKKKHEFNLQKWRRTEGKRFSDPQRIPSNFGKNKASE